MNPQLATLFATHKTALMVAGAAGVAGLALLKRKKASGAAGTTITPGGTVLGAVSPQTIPTQGYDSSASDVYNALQPQIAQILNQQQTAPLPVPAPVASTLFAPTGSGNYVQYGNGTVAEIESDGSQLGLSWGQWQPLAAGGAKPSVKLPGGAVGQYYETAGNLAAKTKPAS